MNRSTLKRIKESIAYFRCIARDPRTPRASRYLLLAALAYLASPIDLIPDFIPVLGHLDDVIIVPALIWVALLLVPIEVKDDADIDNAIDDLLGQFSAMEESKHGKLE